MSLQNTQLTEFIGTLLENETELGTDYRCLLDNTHITNLSYNGCGRLKVVFLGSKRDVQMEFTLSPEEVEQVRKFDIEEKT